MQKIVIFLILLTSWAPLAAQKNTPAAAVAQPARAYSEAEQRSARAAKVRSSHAEAQQAALNRLVGSGYQIIGGTLYRIEPDGRLTALCNGPAPVGMTPVARTSASAAAAQPTPASAAAAAADVKMAAAVRHAGAPAAAAQVPDGYLLPLPPFKPLVSNAKHDIDAYIRDNMPLMQARIRHLQQCFYACVRATMDEALIVARMQKLQLESKSAPTNNEIDFFPVPHDWRGFLADACDLACKKFETTYLQGGMGAETKAFTQRYRAVDSNIEDAGAMDSFNEFVNNGHMLQSEGLIEVEIKHFEAIGMQTAGEGEELVMSNGKKQETLVYWISCDGSREKHLRGCGAQFKAGWHHAYYHKPRCRFFQQFNFNERIENPNPKLAHMLQAMDLAAHHSRLNGQETPSFQIWNALHDLRNSTQWQLARWNLFLNYSEDSFEEDRAEAFAMAVEKHQDGNNSSSE